MTRDVEVELGSKCAQKQEYLSDTDKLFHANSRASPGLRKFLSLTISNTLDVLVLICLVILQTLLLW